MEKKEKRRNSSSFENSGNISCLGSLIGWYELYICRSSFYDYIYIYIVLHRFAGNLNVSIRNDSLIRFVLLVKRYIFLAWM